MLTYQEQSSAGKDFLICLEHKTSHISGSLAKWLNPGLVMAFITKLTMMSGLSTLVASPTEAPFYITMKMVRFGVNIGSSLPSSERTPNFPNLHNYPNSHKRFRVNPAQQTTDTFMHSTHEVNWAQIGCKLVSGMLVHTSKRTGKTCFVELLRFVKATPNTCVNLGTALHIIGIAFSYI
eukprot:2706592-Amphidinium_carterae.2